MRRIAVVTVARSDYGHLRSVLDGIQAEPALELVLVAAATHFSADHGATLGEIEADGYAVAARVPMTDADDSALGVDRSIARGVSGFGEALEDLAPDLVVVLGDRYEMHAAALAAVPFRIPIAHIHGGESSEGAFDESLRHSITKLSHLHFAATEEYARRIVQMGEEPWRVAVSGAPGLDAISRLEPLPGAQLDELVGLSLDEPTVLVTYHPPTLTRGGAAREAGELLAALEEVHVQVLFTAPNADPESHDVLALVQDFAASHEHASFVASLGSRAYLSALHRVSALAGNSSSGVIEAASFELPVVNVGDRQQGRIRAANVIDAPGRSDELVAALRRALSAEFRAGLAGLVNPYGDGRAAERIVARLRDAPLDRGLLVKRFHEVPG
jgi:UDP-hydrolysing UDP-N-acetyl-D-glucosamine 2-epimerase